MFCLSFSADARRGIQHQNPHSVPSRSLPPRFSGQLTAVQVCAPSALAHLPRWLHWEQLHLFQLTATAASTVGFSCRLRGVQCFKTEFVLMHGCLLIGEIFSLFLGLALLSSGCSEAAEERPLQLEVGLLFSSASSL